MSKKIITIFSIILLLSCSNKEFVILIEQPNESELNNVLLEIKVNNNKIYSDHLKTTNIASIFDNVSFEHKNDEAYSLEVYVGSEKFQYEVKYPEDRYIILSPFYKEDKINIGILKREEKFILE